MSEIRLDEKYLIVLTEVSSTSNTKKEAKASKEKFDTLEECIELSEEQHTHIVPVK